MQLVGRVYANCIICKHLGHVGVTKEHIMCANAIICTLLWGVGAHHVPNCYYLHAFKGGWRVVVQAVPEIGYATCADAIICTYAGGG